MSNIGSFFNLGSQTTFVNQGNRRLRLKINPSQQEDSDISFVFPANEGDASGYVLATDGSGTTSWVAQSGGGSTNPAGPTNAIQFNGGASDFSGVSNLTFDSTTNTLVVDGNSNLGAVDISQTLVVDGNSTLGGVLTVNALSDLSAVDISNTLDVSGATTLDGVLNVNALTFLNNNVDVSGDISCNSRIVLSTFETTVSGDEQIFRLFNNGINIGDPSCGLIDQSWNNIAIGFGAGYDNQGVFNIAIGQEAGKTNQGQGGDGNCIAIGYKAGETNQEQENIAIGSRAGQTDQSNNAIAIGSTAGSTSQGASSIAIGETAGETNQGASSIAIGETAGETNQGFSSIAIGPLAGQNTQGSSSIAIGFEAGRTKLGQNSIAIGYQAENDNSTNNVTQNVIVLNATNSPFNSDASSAFFVKPLRDLSNNGSRGNFRVMIYDETRGEIGFDSSYNGTGGSTNPGGDANAIQFNGGATDFSGVSNLTFDSSTNVLGVSGDVSTNTLNVSGTSTLDGVLTVNADSSLNNVFIRKGTDASNATLTLDNSSSLVMSPQIYTQISDFSGQDLEPVSSILIFDYSNNQDVDCSLNYNTGIIYEGQHLSIFYLNRNPGNLRIDFGDNNIVTGSGANRYLTFTTFGQSAELLAYGNTNNYLVFNTGATASS